MISDSPHMSWYSLCGILVLILAAFTHRRVSRRSIDGKEHRHLQQHDQVQSCNDKGNDGISWSCASRGGSHLCDLNRIRSLCFQLSNLESHHGQIVPEALSMLQTMFSDALEKSKQHSDESISDVEVYSRENLTTFLERQRGKCMERFEKYTLGRRTGGGREMFPTPGDVPHMLKRLAPLKLIDGAWLSNIHKLSTPFSLRKTTRKAWQIFSEELGDGDLCKNHVYIYSRLLEEINRLCPEPHTLSFSQWQHDEADCAVWKAALGQQLLSTFIDDFLPETLGLNLQFEGVEYGTLVAARELKELGYDPSYFLMHICIDNAHSGHSAIALEIVDEYLCHVQDKSGRDSAQMAWNRICNGYILSQRLNEAMSESPLQLPTAPKEPDQIEEVVANIIASKAQSAQGVHCTSAMKVGGLSIGDWLDKVRLNERSWNKKFLGALANSKHLVKRGDSSKSRLIKDIVWGGKMFGCFTDSEVKALRRWIDGLPANDGQARVGLRLLPTNLQAGVSVHDEKTSTTNDCSSTPVINAALHNVTEPAYPFTTTAFGWSHAGKPNITRLLPLWFASIGLLENFLSVPSKVANAHGCTVVRILRAQYGLPGESAGVGGMDEAMCTHRIDLVDVGMSLWNSCGLDNFVSVYEIVQRSRSLFAREMLALAARPEQNCDILIGLSCAFAELHQVAIAFVPTQFRGVLEDIAQREREGLKDWLRIQGSLLNASIVCKAYKAGLLEIAKCF